MYYHLYHYFILSLQQEKQRWMLRKEEIQQNAETFGKVSPLLSWFAHRVTTHVMKDDDTDEEDEAALEEGALVKKQVITHDRVYWLSGKSGMLPSLLANSLLQFILQTLLKQLVQMGSMLYRNLQFVTIIFCGNILYYKKQMEMK